MNALASLGIELELAVLLGIALLGMNLFAPFEVETPAWRKMLKWSLVVLVTLTLYTFVGHWALLPALALAALGLTFHFVWCARHGIDPWRATPRRRYYELRGWEWHE